MTENVIQEPAIIADTSVNNATTVTPIETKIETNTVPVVETAPIAPVEPVAPVTTPDVVTAPEQVDTAWKDELKKQIGDDEKLLKIVDKYKSPKDIVTSNAELLKKLSSTRPLPQLPENATPDQLKEFREAAGIPEDPKAYEVDLEIPEALKEGIERYYEIAHANNRPASVVKQAVADYMKLEEARSKALVEQIQQTQQASEKQLKESWGVQYDTNKAVVDSFFDKTFGEDAADIKGAYLPDGTRLGDNAKVMAKLLDVSKNNLGASTIISNNLIKEVTGIQERLAVLNKMATSGDSTYWGANHEQFKQERDQLSAQLEDVKKNRR